MCEDSDVTGVAAPAVASHVVPGGAIPKSAMREHLSEAYLQMIASAAGLTVGDWGDDYDGVDTTLKTKVDYFPNKLQPKLDVQLKCTGQKKRLQTATHVSWSLERRTIEFLRASNRSDAALFCVLVAPGEPGFWLTKNLNGLLAHSHMYFLRGPDLPEPKPKQKKQTVKIPLANELNPQSLLDLMEEASRWHAA